MSSGYMPLVCWNMWRRRVCSSTSKRLAMPGRYHTGSTAALVMLIWPLASSTLPSGTREPSRTMLEISGRSTCARVTAMVGRMCWLLITSLKDWAGARGRE